MTERSGTFIESLTVRYKNYSINLDGSGEQTRYRGHIQFDYAKNFPQTADIAKLKSDFDAAFPSQEKATALQMKTIISA